MSEPLEKEISEVSAKVIKLELTTHYQEKRMDKYEELSLKHMEKEDQRWEKIEKHMRRVNQIVAIGTGVAMTLGFLWMFLKDIVRMFG